MKIKVIICKIVKIYLPVIRCDRHWTLKCCMEFLFTDLHGQYGNLVGVQKDTLCRSDCMTKMKHEDFFVFMETICI